MSVISSISAPHGSSSSLSCVDLFSGAGGFSLAAQLCGLEVAVAVESDANAVATYKQNFCVRAGGPVVVAEDIRTVDPSEIRAQSFGDDRTCDLLLGGPPCQGFSTHRLKGAGIADPRNDLIHVYFDWVKEFAPSAFLMENVPGMLWDRHASTLQRFYEEAASAGYTIKEPVVIDARDFGVPQRRKRVFILGVRSELGELAFSWPPKATHGNDVARANDPHLEPWRACINAFVKAKADDPNDTHMRHGKELLEAFRRTPHNGGSRKESGRVLKCHKKHNGHKDVYGRIDSNAPAPTMTTACINPSKGRFVHPTKDHGITAREAARIQTFPDSFVFVGGLMAAGIQIGNAVPVQLGRALIEHLIPLLAAAKVLRSDAAAQVSERAVDELDSEAA